MRLTVGTKICLGFAAVLGTMIVGQVIAGAKRGVAHHMQEMVIDVQYPSAKASTTLEADIYASFAALRGYMSGGDKHFIEAREHAWKDMDKVLEKMRELSTHWLNQANKDRFARVQDNLKALRQVQDTIEQFAQSEENVPASATLAKEIAPRGAKMIESLTVVIDAEQKQEATAQRKSLLGALADNRGSLGMTIAAARAYMLTGQESFKEEFHTRWAVNAKAFERAESMANLFTSAQRSAWENYRNERQAMDESLEKMITQRGAQDWNKAEFLTTTKAEPLAASLKKDLDDMIHNQTEMVAKETEELEAANSTAAMTTNIAVGLSVLIGALTAVFVARGVSRSVAPIVRRTGEIASGDLTGADLKVLANDELGTVTESVNKMAHSLREIVAEMSRSSEEVSAAATEIAASAEEMSSNVRQQTAQLGEVTSATTEMAASVSMVATKSADAAKAAEDSGKTAETGAQTVSGTIDDMNQIAVQSQASVSRVQTLGEQGKKIGEVVTVINDIAEQINLLALNAAIEAARAGEHGRGFAVVADEVRKLADRTQGATKEISASITGIRTETDRVVESIQDGSRRVEAGTKRASSAGESLQNILGNVRSVAEIVQSIAAAAREQSAAGEEISRSIEGIAASAKESESGAAQAAAAAAQLSGRAETLRALVNRFKLPSETSRQVAKQPAAPASATAPNAKGNRAKAMASV